jgi:hypothetical protein
LKKVILLLLIAGQVILNAEFIKITKAVLDTKKNLMWQDDEEVLIQEDIVMAKVYCDTLILNGYTDWYLPKVKQLQGIIDITNKKGYIDKKFQYFKEDKYWANSPFVGENTLFWFVDFKSGKSNFISTKEQNYIRCVRDINE